MALSDCEWGQGGSGSEGEVALLCSNGDELLIADANAITDVHIPFPRIVLTTEALGKAER